MRYGTEEQALLCADAYLKKLCRRNWKSMEYEDRFSELRLFFLCAWRKLPTNTGHFLEDFERLCREHMRKVARGDSFHRYAVLSMDAALICKNGAEHFTLSEISPRGGRNGARCGALSVLAG